jgi:hypothetical protein
VSSVDNQNIVTQSGRVKKILSGDGKKNTA